jgi:hypothetical protein
VKRASPFSLRQFLSFGVKRQSGSFCNRLSPASLSFISRFALILILSVPLSSTAEETAGMNFDYWRKGKLQGTTDKVLLINEYPVEFVVHVRNDWPELRDVLDKALEAMPEDESSAIINRWSTVRFEHGIRPRDIAKWGLIFLVSASGIIFLFLFWNRTLKGGCLNVRLNSQKVNRVSVASSITGATP